MSTPETIIPQNEMPAAKPHKTKLPYVGTGFVVLLLFLFMAGFFPRQARSHTAALDNQRSNPVVNVATPILGAATSQLLLPANVEPFLKTSIYSRTNGTLQKRLVDIGDYVRTGQVLATISNPDLDQELNQAVAALAQAKASLEVEQTRLWLARKNLERWQKNAAMGGVSKQEVDQHEADYKSSTANINLAQANIQQQEANIKRLQALRSYEIIRAPFSGMITEKNVDPGANIVAGGSVTSTSMFTIVQSDMLRIFVDVPQSMVLGVHKGLSAQLTVPEMPNQQFTAKVARLAGALDEKSRTLRVELHLPNHQHKLFPGMFARLTLDMPMPVQHLQIPDNTIVVANEGLKVVQVLPDNRVHFLSIQTGRDSGENTEVLSGLTGAEKLITNPSDTLKEGQSVQPVE